MKHATPIYLFYMYYADNFNWTIALYCRIIIIKIWKDINYRYKIEENSISSYVLYYTRKIEQILHIYFMPICFSE